LQQTDAEVRGPASVHTKRNGGAHA
jgi:hypothetical protein